jgi:tripartite-type tricarboxylate transporter receptor subunit TctC
LGSLDRPSDKKLEEALTMRKILSCIVHVVPWVLLAACSLPFAATDARAQNTYPVRSIRMLVGSAPGGTTDLVARVISKKMGDLLGQTIIVDNRPGANQSLAAEMTAKAAPDGYTVLMAPAGFSINPVIYKKLPFDPIKDFTPVVEVALAPNVLLVNPSVPARTVKELIALAKAKPGSISYGSSGVGSPSHLAGALFALMTKTELLHVAYRGSGPAMSDLLGGSIKASFPSVPGALPFIASGQLIALGVTTRVRSSSLKDVPTIEEAGVPGYDVGSWFGIVGPAGLPQPVVTRLNEAANAALKAPEVRELMERIGAEPLGGKPEEFATTISADIKKWTEVFKSAKIELQ